MGKEYAWSWADYEREERKRKARLEKKAKRARAIEQLQPDPAPEPVEAEPERREAPQAQPRAGANATSQAGGRPRPAHEGPRKNNPILPPENSTADSAGGCEGQAPAGPKGPVEVSGRVPRKACQPRNHTRPMPNGRRIDLSGAKSLMEESVRLSVKDTPSSAPAPRRFDGATALCRCGGKGANSTGPVPAWFGKDCIEGDCPLKKELH
ncbi:hypothetical protein [Aurantiacibacter zhengii]|uniref:Uncharacterized protein n=1 Tax=Aurantiacibacter zhengii TaxID=2307003 RepID=A0A418NU34_9SPHN|nr:hypothetical protein [Aurantiacibacter zhengii]RIV87484.1 hypothetical protein D2V07_03800 [Aurantiacibacter zhengii]